MVAQYKIKYPGKIFIGVVRGQWSEAVDDPSLNNAVRIVDPMTFGVCNYKLSLTNPT